MQSIIRNKQTVFPQMCIGNILGAVTHTLCCAELHGKPCFDWNPVNKTCYPISLRTHIIELRSPRSVLPPKQRAFCPPARVKTSTVIVHGSEGEHPNRTERDGCFNILSGIFSSGRKVIFNIELYSIGIKYNLQNTVFGLRVCPYVGERKLQPHPRIMLPQ